MFLRSIIHKIHIPHLLKRMPRQQAIRTGLMALPNRPVHLQGSSHPVQPTVQALTEPHHVLHVINSISEKHPLDFQKFLHPTRQAPAREDLHQVPEVVRAVERDPTHRVIANESRRHHQLREPDRVDPILSVPLEVDPLPSQQLDRVRRVLVTRHVEVAEVEFPDEPVITSEVGKVPVGVGEGQTHLDEVQNVDVLLQNPVMIGRQKLAVVRLGRVHGRPDNQTRKLGVHGNIRVAVDHVPDQLEFGFQIIRPDLPDLNRFQIVNSHS